MRSIILLLGLITIHELAYSQTQTARQIWSRPLGFNTQWLHLAADGTLIVATKDQAIDTSATMEIDTVDYTTLHGVDQATGNIKWKLKSPVKGLVPGVDPIPNLPYLQLRNVPLTIIDPSDGRIVVNIIKERLTKVYKHGFLYQSGHLWIDGVFGGSRSLSLFDLSTGKKLWSRSDYYAGPDKSKMTAFATLAGAANGVFSPRLLSGPINNGNDKMIFVIGDALFYNSMFQVDIATGEIQWITEAPNPNKGKLVRVEVDTSFFRLIPGPRRFFFVRANWLTACDYKDGQQMWNSAVKTSGKVGEIIYDSRGMILCTVSSDVKSMISTGHFRMVNENTGAEIWPQPLKFNGGLSKYQYTEKGLAVVTENPESGASILNFIDVDNGKYTLKDALHLAGKIKTLQIIPKGVYYSTDRSVMIVDMDGKELVDVPKHNIIQGKLPVADGDTKSYVLYKQDQNLYEIDKMNAMARVLNKEKIDFKGMDSPDRLEIRKEGVVLYSNQNVTFINLDGTTRYTVHYKAVWNLVEKLQLFRSLFDVILEASKGIMQMSAEKEKQLSAPGLTTAQKDQIRTDSEKALRSYAEVGTAEFATSLKAFNEVKLRATGSSAAGAAIVILTVIDHRNVLAIVNKDTGEMIYKVVLVDGDDEPMYEMDASTGRLFYAGKNMNGLSGFEVMRN